VLFRLLPKVCSSAELVNRFDHFKIGNLPMLYRFAGNVVMWATDYDAAMKLANALKAPLQPFTAAGLPTGVKPVSVGVGISTEPEVGFDPIYQARGHAREDMAGYRAEVIARGLIDAAGANSCALPGPSTCAEFVALKFAEYGLDL
jgi:hypothetical protein